MTYSWERLPNPPPAPDIPAELRRVFAMVSDALIPGGQMPAPSDVGVGERLDAVIRSRPDLLDPLLTVLRAAPSQELDSWVADLARTDPAGHRALVVAVLASYYLSDEVRGRLGYPGQEAAVVNIGFPAYVEEGLLERVIDRGPLYRSVEDAD